MSTPTIDAVPPSDQLLAASIDLRECSVILGNRPILVDLSVRIAASKITAILGPSGCGKSTLLRVIAGLQPPSQGELDYFFGDQRLPRLQPGQLAYVFQDAALMPWRTVEGNVVVPLEILGRGSASERRDLVASHLRQVSLEQRDATKYPDQLSGGMKMRVSIARALITDPPLLLLDEPFSALDDLLRRRLGDLVLELHRQRPRTIVLVTHNIDEAILMSDALLVMGHGMIATEIPISLPSRGAVDVRQSPEYLELYRTVSAALREIAR